MKKLFCDICGKEILCEPISIKGDKNHYTYMLYKYVDGLYVAQDLYSKCHIKLYDLMEEMKDE